MRGEDGAARGVNNGQPATSRRRHQCGEPCRPPARATRTHTCCALSSDTMRLTSFPPCGGLRGCLGPGRKSSVRASWPPRITLVEDRETCAPPPKAHRTITLSTKTPRKREVARGGRRQDSAHTPNSQREKPNLLARAAHDEGRQGHRADGDSEVLPVPNQHVGDGEAVGGRLSRRAAAHVTVTPNSLCGEKRCEA